MSVFIYIRSLLAQPLSLRFKRGGFAMSFMYIAKPPAFVLFAYSGSLFDRRIAFRSA
jgi:hypothetical protein